MFDLVNDKKTKNKVMLFSLFAAVALSAAAYAAGVFNEPAHELLEKPFMMVVFGFLGCWVLIIAAKIIMTPLLQRDEDYYQKGDDDADV